MDLRGGPLGFVTAHATSRPDAASTAQCFVGLVTLGLPYGELARLTLVVAGALCRDTLEAIERFLARVFRRRCVPHCPGAGSSQRCEVRLAVSRLARASYLRFRFTRSTGRSERGRPPPFSLCCRAEMRPPERSPKFGGNG